MLLSIDELKGLFPNAIPGILEAILDTSVDEAQLNNTRRFSCYVAQWGYETDGFRVLKEIGGPKYLRKYEGRRDLGNVRPGDGVRYCGRGLPMLTGRYNYRICGRYLNLPLEEQPELVEHPDVAVRAGNWFWNTRQCNYLSDHGLFLRLTRRINGGSTGYRSRRALLESIENIMNLPEEFDIFDQESNKTD